jgi:hypothetical protein
MTMTRFQASRSPLLLRSFMSGMCALLIRGYGQNVPPCTSALGQRAVFGPGGSGTCGFKAALPRQRLSFCAILSIVAVRSYYVALRSSMVVVGGVEVSFPTLTPSRWCPAHLN